MQTRPEKEFKRRSGVMFLFIALAFLFCASSVFYVSVIKGKKFKLYARENQLAINSIEHKRGTIYSSDMTVLATSADAWLLTADPSNIDKDHIDEVSTAVAGVLGKDTNEIKRLISDKNKKYVILEKKAETEVKDALLELNKMSIDTGKLNKDGTHKMKRIASGVFYATANSKRYYPNSSFASSIVGFTNTGLDTAAENTGSGLELFYNSKLSGINGRTVRSVDNRGNVIAADFNNIYNGVDGLNAVLTINEVVQYYLEDALEKAIADNESKYAYGIVMDPKTGAILGMSSKPDYNLNNPSQLSSHKVMEKLNKITDENERNIQTSAAVYTQWRNHCVSDTYQPGSVFKTIVLAAALEEGVVNEGTTYTCTGGIQVADNYIKCWRHEGHGTETLEQGLMNSCNPFYVTIGQKLGAERWSKYFEAFGFTEKTGIDLPAEASPKSGVTYHDPQKFSVSQLSSSSFGQTFQVTPLQMLTAVSAIANKGKLMQPYIVSKWIDENGQTVESTAPTVKRQVISESTANLVSKMMESVVSKGTGKNAYVEGYRIAGKTGTSQKFGAKGVEANKYILSFAGFAPADDPRVAVLICVDEPIKGDGGGSVAAPIAGDLISKVLESMGVIPEYDDKSTVQSTNVTIPNLVGKNKNDAKNLAGEQNIVFVGKGNSVVSQTPSSGTIIRKGGTIICYTDENNEKVKEKVPDFNGMTANATVLAARSAGFNIKIANSSASSDFTAYKQSIVPGTEAEKGTVITVYYKSGTNVSDG